MRVMRRCRIVDWCYTVHDDRADSSRADAICWFAVTPTVGGSTRAMAIVYGSRNLVARKYRAMHGTTDWNRLPWD